MTTYQVVTVDTTNGVLQLLPTGSDVDASTNDSKVTATNNTGGTLVKLSAVYQTGTADEVADAQANAIGTTRVVGLVTADIAAAASGSIQHNGVISGTTGEWDAVTGDSGGLTPGAAYYLDPDTAGNLTTTVPTTSGDFIKLVGIAHSTTEMILHVEDEPISLG